MADEPQLDADDIQGNILPGFRRRYQLLVGYSAGSEGVLRQSLAVLASRVTAVAPVIQLRDARKTALEAGLPEPEIPDLWVNLALGARALDRLGERGVRALDRAFDVGMRPSRTGDPWSAIDSEGNPNPWSPSNWKVGKPSIPLDLLLILGFDDWAACDGEQLLATLSANGLEEIYREDGIRLPADIEHFGFMDGISEIGVRGEMEIDGVVRLVTTRYGVPPRDGVEYGRPGQPLAWPGQFLIGTATGRNSLDPAPPQYRNGSFLVFRRLTQDVRAFDEDTLAIANQVSIPPAQLRAAIIGRWPSGAALMRHGTDPATSDDPLTINHFQFGVESPNLQLGDTLVTGAAADPAPIRGLTCPAFAHIRKVNPRDLPTDLGDATMTQGFQMLRRGIPFGPLYDRVNPENPVNNSERGLLFLAYQRNPSLQFEKLNTSWMNTDDGPGPGGFDLLVGQRVSPKTGTYDLKDATLYHAAEPVPGRGFMANRTWVKPSGGAYLFAPSISHIAAMATVSAPRAWERSNTYSAAFDSLILQDTLLSMKSAEFNVTGLTQTQMQRPRHDGEVCIRSERGRDELLTASWPETALLAPAALALKGAALTELDLSGLHFPTESLSTDEATLLAQTASLRSIKLDGVTLNGATLAMLLRSLPYLTEINLAGVDIDDADVATFVEDRHPLVQLSLGLAEIRQGHRFGSPRLTGRVINTLDSLTSLRRLSLRGIPVTDAELVTSDIWDRLSQTDLSETRISDAGVIRLAASPTLGELRIESTAVGDEGATALLNRRWHSLDLSWTRVSQRTLTAMRYPECLRKIRLAGLQVDDDLAGLLNRTANLEAIDLSSTSVGDEVAIALGSLTQLKSVGLNVASVGPDGLGRLLHAPIKDLEASGIQTDSVARVALARSASLERVSLSTGVDWQGLEAIRAEVTLTAAAPVSGGPPPRLKELQLNDRLTRSFASQLQILPSLRLLSVSGIDADVVFNAGFAHLQEVRAEASGLTDEMVARLVALPSIAALYISHNELGSAFKGSLSPSLHTIELRNTSVDDSAIKAISRLPRLHCIDVPNTRVSAGGVATLVRNAVNLQSLALDGRQIEKATVNALVHCKRLLELYLYGAEVNNASIAAIASVHLRELQLIGSGIDDEAVPYLAAIPGLRRLSLSGELTEGGIYALRELRPLLDIRPGYRMTGVPTGRISRLNSV